MKQVNINNMKVVYLGLMTSSVGFNKAFRDAVDEYYVLSCGDKQFNHKAVELCKNIKPDLVFMQIQNSGIITEDTAKKIKECSKLVINWTGDVRSPIPQWYFDIGKHIDMTCFSNMTDVRIARAKGLRSEYLEIGYDPEIYKPEGASLPTKDIVFMGNNYGDLFPLSGYRKEMVDFLKKEYPNNFAVYGNGWSNSDGSFNHSQPEEAKIYRGCKVAINLSHFDYERYNSDRILRIMGVGVPVCLTKLYPSIEEDYEVGEHLDAWEDFEELKEAIDFYLDNDKLRVKMAKKGMEHVKKEHSYDAMIKNILKLKK